MMQRRASARHVDFADIVNGGFMPIMKKLRDLFDEAKVSYEVYNHPLAYTAQEIAAQQHFSATQWRKS